MEKNPEELEGNPFNFLAKKSTILNSPILIERLIIGLVEIPYFTNNVIISIHFPGKEEKRMIIIAAATSLKDTIVLDNIAKCPNTFRYHNQYKRNNRSQIKQCYKVYSCKFKRYHPSASHLAPELEATTEDEKKAIDTPARLRKSTRSRSDSGEIQNPKLPKSKKTVPVCEICLKLVSGSWPNQNKKLFRISEMKVGDSRATRFLSAMKFNEDNIHKKFIFCQTVEDLFAADVYYHSKCMILYLMNYERHVNKLLQNIRREDTEVVLGEDVNLLLENLDLESQAYTLSDITKMINDALSFDNNNRRTKAQLIKLYGENISFSYSRDRSKPQFVFKRSVKVESIIEGRLRGYDAVKECARTLAIELKSHSFNLNESLCLSTDLRIAMDRYSECRPPHWLKFVTEIFADSRHKKEEEWFIKFDSVFQFFYYWLSGKMTPMHCAITEMIHCLSKSREIINMVSRFGFGMSYDSMKRIDVGIVEDVKEKTGDNRGPVNDCIKSGTPIQGAIDNFNHKERTPTGGDISNDTVMVIWQNSDSKEETQSTTNEISKRPKLEERKRSLDCRLPCQELIESKLIKNTGEISQGFTPDMNYKQNNSLLKRAEEDNSTWFFARNLQHVSDKTFTSNVPSQTAVRSKLLSAVQNSPKKTIISFFPILPYPATQMDSIYTSMVNFKDVLYQRGETCGALWCDEGVYCLAKEIQMLKPEQFGMLFIGLGPFHWSKIVMGAIGKWLNASGIGEALTNSGVFTQGAAKSVLQGGDYVKAKDGMNIIAEAITLLQFKAFLKSEDYELKKNDLGLEDIKYDMDEVFRNLYVSSNVDAFQGAWELAKVTLEKLNSAFNEFRKSHNADQNYEYWNLFLDHMYPCIRDFEASVRTGKWELFVSAVERSLVLFFATGRPNYSRYGPLFHQDCLDLQRKFPGIYKHFKKGMFVCYMSERYGSGIGFDQGLEKAYNHTAKSVGGIIGITRQKQAVAMWDIIKHEKDLYVSFAKETTKGQETRGELDSLHHEFNLNQAQATHGRMQQLVHYIESVSNPFLSDATNKLTNLTSKEAVENVDYLLDCLDHGRRNYEQFLQERFVHKEKGLHEKISSKYEPSTSVHNIVEKQKKVKVTSDDQENSSAVSFIQYATARGRKVEDVLSYPITSRPIYLLEPESTNQKKATKGTLTSSLLKLLNKEFIIVGQDEQRVPHVKTTAVVIDFMSVVRRFSSVKMSNVKSFGSFTAMILGAIISYGSASDAIHVVLENYSELSIKSAERARRATKDGKKTAPIYCEVVSVEQTLPTSFEEFFRRTSNKVSLQNFFVDYCRKHYSSDKSLYIAGGGRSDPDKCIKITGGAWEEAKVYRASHEEADDRMMYSINKLYESTPDNCSISVVSPDADIFVTLLYHLRNKWHGMELYLLKKGRVKEDKMLQNELYPLHKLILNLSPNVNNNLPAGHALTGCDSVAKVGTKPSLLKVLKTDGSLIQDFGVDRLDEEMIDQAESFLVKVIATKEYKVSILDQTITFLN